MAPTIFPVLGTLQLCLERDWFFTGIQDTSQVKSNFTVQKHFWGINFWSEGVVCGFAITLYRGAILRPGFRRSTLTSWEGEQVYPHGAKASAYTLWRRVRGIPWADKRARSVTWLVMSLQTKRPMNDGPEDLADGKGNREDRNCSLSLRCRFQHKRNLQTQFGLFSCRSFHTWNGDCFLKHVDVSPAQDGFNAISPARGAHIGHRLQKGHIRVRSCVTS